MHQSGKFMFRIVICLLTVLFVAGSVDVVSAQTATTAPAKPSRMRLTAERLKEMKAKWSENRVKLKACRKEVKRQGLMGDDRWFYIADCMDKS
jgi:Ni/Co efflux regulator RcnB